MQVKYKRFNDLFIIKQFTKGIMNRLIDMHIIHKKLLNNRKIRSL